MTFQFKPSAFRPDQACPKPAALGAKAEFLCQPSNLDFGRFRAGMPQSVVTDCGPSFRVKLFFSIDLATRIPVLLDMRASTSSDQIAMGRAPRISAVR